MQLIQVLQAIVSSQDVALVEVAAVKRGWSSDWRDALEEPFALWDGGDVAEALRLMAEIPESDLYRCFSPGFGIRLHDATVARAEVLFCFQCHRALILDLRKPSRHAVSATFDPESVPARDLLARFRGAST